MDQAFASLPDRYAKYDGQNKDQSDFQPVLPAFRTAHDAWKQWATVDCEFARIHAGNGTDRIDAPVRCSRDRTAERALLYRRQLYGGPMW